MRGLTLSAIPLISAYTAHYAEGNWTVTPTSDVILKCTLKDILKVYGHDESERFGMSMTSTSEGTFIYFRMHSPQDTYTLNLAGWCRENRQLSISKSTLVVFCANEFPEEDRNAAPSESPYYQRHLRTLAVPPKLSTTFSFSSTLANASRCLVHWTKKFLIFSLCTLTTYGIIRYCVYVAEPRSGF